MLVLEPAMVLVLGPVLGLGPVLEPALVLVLVPVPVLGQHTLPQDR